MNICLLIFQLSSIVCPSDTTLGDSLVKADRQEVHYERLALVIGGTAGIITMAHLQNYNSWWKGERSNFKIREDGAYALGSDKLGHFYFTYLSSNIISRSLCWSGIERKKSFWYGAAIGLGFQLYVEVEDGFTKALGFSIGDAVADIGGALYPVLQNEKPWFENVRFKWSFILSEKYKQGLHRTIIDDYESQYFWLSFSQDGLPKFLQGIFPDFLGLTIGYGVKNLDGEGGGEKELYFGLDYNFEGLPGGGSFLSSLKHALNYFHFPAPTIRFTPSVITYGFRF